MMALGKRSILAAGLVAAFAGCRAPAPLPPAPALHEPVLAGGIVPVSHRFAAAAPGDAPADLPDRRQRHARRTATQESVQPVRWQGTGRPPGVVGLGLPRPFPKAGAVPEPGLGRAGDYRWLSGCLHQDPISCRWSIRYAAPGTDEHGGIMDLVAPGPMDGFHPGQMVRVEGALVDPAPLQVRPGYRPASIQAQAR